MHNVEELRDYGTDPPKMTRPPHAAEAILQSVFIHNDAGVWGVHPVRARQEDRVNTSIAAQLQITRFVTRILFEIFVRPELGGVYKDAQADHIRLLLGLFHKRKMSGMEIPHGGHKADAFSRAILLPRPVGDLARKAHHVWNNHLTRRRLRLMIMFNNNFHIMKIAKMEDWRKLKAVDKCC